MIILERVQLGDTNSYQDCYGQIWTFVCKVRDAEHVEELRKTYSMYRISQTDIFRVPDSWNQSKKCKKKTIEGTDQSVEISVQLSNVVCPVGKIKARL